MKVVILAGGLGTRLREETEFKPKPMVHIGTRPILWHIMKIYAHYGFNDFIICLGYKGEMIKEYFYHYELLNNDFTVELGKNKKDIEIYNNHQEEGWRITLVDTGDKSLKGARLKKVEKYIDGDIFMMTYGDGIADINIDSLLSHHKNHGKLATVTGINPSARFGEMKINGNRVEAFWEKPKNGAGFVNGGFFVFQKGIFDYLFEEDNCDLEIGPLSKMALDGELMIYKHTGFWTCMDTLRDTEYLNNLWQQKKAPWNVWSKDISYVS